MIFCFNHFFSYPPVNNSLSTSSLIKVVDILFKFKFKTFSSTFLAIFWAIDGDISASLINASIIRLRSQGVTVSLVEVDTKSDISVLLL